MPSEMSKKALADGIITKKQYDKLPPHFLEAIIKSKRKKGGGAKKTASKVAKKKVAKKKGKK